MTYVLINFPVINASQSPRIASNEILMHQKYEKRLLIFFLYAKNLKLKYIFFFLKYMYQQFFNLISNFFCSEFYLYFILTIFIPFDKCIKIYNVIYFIFLGLFIISKLLNSMCHFIFLTKYKKICMYIIFMI